MPRSIGLFALGCLSLVKNSHSSSSSSTGSSSTGFKSSDQSARVRAPFLDVPTNVFAPHGRLYDVEDVVHTITSSSNPSSSSTSLVVLQCKDGIVAVTTVAQSPYIQQDNENEEEYDDPIGISFLPTTNHKSNASSIQNWHNVSLSIQDDDCSMESQILEDYTTTPPFGRIVWTKQRPISTTTVTSAATTNPIDDSTSPEMTSHHNFQRSRLLSTTNVYAPKQGQPHQFVLGMTAGNVVESQIQRHRWYSMLPQCNAGLDDNDSSTLSVLLARSIADQNQQRTQLLSENRGRMVAATTVLVDFGMVYAEHSDYDKNSTTALNAHNDDTSTSINTTTRVQNGTNHQHRHRATVYQIDPSGQYWICQAVVAGRCTTIIQQRLHDLVQERFRSVPSENTTNTTTNAATQLSLDDNKINDKLPTRISSSLTRTQVCSVLSQLSIDDAMTMATQCLVEGIIRSRSITNNEQDDALDTVAATTRRLRTRLRGVAIFTNNSNDHQSPTVSIQTYSHYGLLSRLQNSEQCSK
jgi:20S proteasome alpha/beta subunit